MSSDVPQGTVLGPLMFSIYISDITEDISSQLRLFADDCLLYHAIKLEKTLSCFNGTGHFVPMGKSMVNEGQPKQVHCYEMYKIPQPYNCKLLFSWIHFICNTQTYVSWSYVG